MPAKTRSFVTLNSYLVENKHIQVLTCILPGPRKVSHPK